MKILYVGAQSAGMDAINAALSGLGENISVSYASGVDRATDWLDRNDGLRVLVVEAHRNRQEWRSALTYAESLPVVVPIVVVVPQEADLQRLALEAYECAWNPSLVQDLPAVITRAVERARLRQLERAADLKRKLAHATAVVEEAEQRHQSAIADAERLASREAELSAQLAGEIDEHRKYECRLVEAETVHSTVVREMEQLRTSLKQSRADGHRLFQQALVPMFRCTRDGVLTQANRLLMTLVGRRSAEEFRAADFAAATFESPNDLSWLIERCLGSRGRESIETTWRRHDGSRLLVRLTAWATSNDVIECGVEDLTPVRVLHDRLSHAHRMEAVGRLATEVAVTCGSLLDRVHQNAQQWLATDGSESTSRQQGEMLLEEVTRAAGLLRQLAAYGDEESRRPAVVELRTVVRDVAPVLKRVAGDAVDVQLSSARAPLNIDAGAERVKRLLVNLAAYGRERMPYGGQLKIELGTSVVDRHFAAKHPNVRLGPHALVTVTESPRAARPDGPLQLQDGEAGSTSRGAAVQTRVELGTLQELVAECGGHLWMTVEPVGGMVVKIRLPLVISYGEPARRTLVPAGRVRSLGNWFHQ